MRAVSFLSFYSVSLLILIGSSFIYFLSSVCLSFFLQLFHCGLLGCLANKRVHYHSFVADSSCGYLWNCYPFILLMKRVEIISEVWCVLHTYCVGRQQALSDVVIVLIIGKLLPCIGTVCEQKQGRTTSFK